MSNNYVCVTCGVYWDNWHVCTLPLGSALPLVERHFHPKIWIRTTETEAALDALIKGLEKLLDEPAEIESTWEVIWPESVADLLSEYKKAINEPS